MHEKPQPFILHFLMGFSKQHAPIKKSKRDVRRLKASDQTPKETQTLTLHRPINP